MLCKQLRLVDKSQLLQDKLEHFSFFMLLLPFDQSQKRVYQRNACNFLTTWETRIQADILTHKKLHYHFFHSQIITIFTLSLDICDTALKSNPLPTWISGLHGRRKMVRTRGTRDSHELDQDVEGRPGSVLEWVASPITAALWASDPLGPRDLAWSDAPACVNNSKAKLLDCGNYN
jgi:hypothetical protein